MVRQGSDQVALPKLPSINAAMSHNDEIVKKTVFRVDIWFSFSNSRPLIRQSRGEQRIKRASYATYISTFPPNDSFWQSDLSSIRRNTYFCWGSLVGWLGLWGGWSEPAVSQDQLSFFENHLYLPRLKTLTLPIYEKKGEKTWITFGLIFVAFTPVPTQLKTPNRWFPVGRITAHTN